MVVSAGPRSIHAAATETKTRITITGTVLFCCRLSASFAFFTIKPKSLPDYETIDVKVHQGDAACEANDSLHHVMMHVEKCQSIGEDIDIVASLPFERCSCRENGEECQQILAYAVSVNGIACGTRRSGKSIELTKNSAKNQKRRPSGRYNSSRSSRFVEWLVDTFGSDYLASSEVGVLDVAGGGNSAGVSFELSQRRKIPSVIIDPRPFKPNKSQRNTLKFQEVGRQKLQPGLQESHLARILFKRFDIWKTKQECSLFDLEFAMTAKGNDLLLKCTAIVGMHPDQATDYIVQLAIQYNKPFAVCPCCVFPSYFRNRSLNGIQVQTYDDLCQYLKRIASGSHEVTLSFAGRNRVIVWLPHGNKEIWTTFLMDNK